MTVYNDYNCSGIFGGTENVGHYLMISADGKRALLVLSDFGGRGNVSVDWARAGFDLNGKKCYRLTPDENTPGKAVEVENMTAEFAAYPAEAYYFAADDSALDGFDAPYPGVGKSGQEFLNEIEKQQLWRKPAPTAKAELRLYLDDRICTALEDSMVADLYDEDVTLGEVTADGFKALGIITPEGMVAPGTANPVRIMPGCTTPAVDLAALLGKGKHKLAVKSFYCGEPFYNFIAVKLLTDTGEVTLEFRNQLEPDRSEINFELELI